MKQEETHWKRIHPTIHFDSQLINNVWSVYKKLGKGNRRVIPSCVLWKIRETFPEENGSYTRFFLYKEHVYKELEAEKGSKNKEFLRN